MCPSFGEEIMGSAFGFKRPRHEIFLKFHSGTRAIKPCYGATGILLRHYQRMKLFCSTILLILGLSSAAAQPAGTERASSTSQKEPALDADAPQKAPAATVATDPGAPQAARIATRPPTPLVRK